MKLIGITGGIGSGKTTVCKIFETLNVPIFYADQVAKALMISDPALKLKIIDIFGEKAYVQDQLNRAHLSQVIFNDKTKLMQMNSVVHPAVFKASNQWKANHSHEDYGLKEAAILFESGSFRHMDKVINVWAPMATRIDRVMLRDGISKNDVERRITNQISSDLRLSLSDYVIENDGILELTPQVIRLHTLLRSKSNSLSNLESLL